MTDPVLLVDVVDRVATLTLNRPEARNALSAELRTAIREAVLDCEARDDVGVLIVTGSDPAFCAGLDLREIGTTGLRSGDGSVSNPIASISKPIIGAINGVAVTGGFELALACDFLIASDRARFADTHARVGIQPGWGLTVLLPQAIGVRRARELSATGNFLEARTALEWGLVNHVVPHEELLPFCRKLAADIVSNDEAGVRRIFATYRDGELGTAREAWDLERAVSAEWLRSGHGSAEAIAERRLQVIERGRDQTAGRRSS